MNDDYIIHSGVIGMRWGVRNGPPYPLRTDVNAPGKLLNELKSFRYKEFDALQSPGRTKKTKAGSCHDQVFYEYTVLRGKGFSPKVKFLIEGDDDNNFGATHSFVYYKQNGKVSWLENAWGGQEGIRSYSSEDDMMRDVYRRWGKNSTYPNVYSGNVNPDKWSAGMSLQEVVDTVDWEE